jgi:hypothetical protein
MRQIYKISSNSIVFIIFCYIELNTTDYSKWIKIPVRLIYPINEQTLNGTNRTAAATAIGGDVATTKIFWDVN